MEISDGISTIKTSRRASRAMTLSRLVKTERADSGLPPARASIHSIEELAKLRCIYPCMSLRTHSLTQFSFHEENSAHLALTGITGMLEDQTGALWLSTNGAGLLKFDREHRRFIRYRNSLADPESLAQNSVRQVFADQEGIIWASLGGFGLTRFTSRPLPFQRYRHDFGNPASRDEPFVGAIYENHQGILWIGAHDALNRIDRKAERYDAFRLTAAGEGSDVITICEDRSAYLWVGTYSQGLFRFHPRTALFRRFQHNPRDPHHL